MIAHVAFIPSHGTGVIGAFNREQLKATLQAVIPGKLKYPEFASGCMEAGVVGYIAFIEGKRVIYYGETGDHHVEWFPGAGLINGEEACSDWNREYRVLVIYQCSDCL